MAEIKVEEKVEYVDPKTLIPYNRNRNTHPPEQIDRIAKLIEANGMRDPLTVSRKSGMVITGNGTLSACLKLGMEKVPVTYQDFDTEDDEYVYHVSHNAIAEWAELDLRGINADLVDIGPVDIDRLGFKNFTVEPLDKYSNKNEENVPDVKESFVKRGEVWKLGNHRLMCGDSTIKEDVEKLMNGEKADFTITSPPYNVGLDYNKYDDNKSEKEYAEFLLKVLNNCRKICTENYWLLWNVGVYPLSLHLHLHLHLLHENFKIKRSIAWIKQGITGPPMIYHMQKNPVVKNYQPNFGWEIIACCHLNDKLKGTKNIPKDLIDECLTDVWNVSQHSNSKDQGKHPGAFPVKIPERAIKLYCEDNVYEPFSGSGSTLIAAQISERNFFGMEIDEHYCSVIIKRWEEFTGLKADKING